MSNKPYALVELNEAQHTLLSELIEGEIVGNLQAMQMVHNMPSERAARYKEKVKAAVAITEIAKGTKEALKEDISK